MLKKEEMDVTIGPVLSMLRDQLLLIPGFLHEGIS